MSYSPQPPNAPPETPPTLVADQDPAKPGIDLKPGLDLKPTQLAGGALAAVTTAVAASFFGVTGTIVGAAFGSVVSSVAAAVYATSLTRAGHRIKTVVVAPAGARGGTGAARPADPAAVPGELTGARSPIVNEAMLLPSGQSWPPPEQAREPGQQQPGGAPVSPERAAASLRRLLRPALVLGGFAFAASLGAIFATELALGHPVAASNESGTTFSHLIHGDTGTRRFPSPPPAASESSSWPSSSSPSSSAAAGSPSGSASDSVSPSSSSPEGTSQATPPADSGQPAPTGTGGSGDAQIPADTGHPSPGAAPGSAAGAPQTTG
jgi:hypothetical protein